MKKTLINAGIIAVLIINSGCASIMDGGEKSVSIKTNPTGAKVTIVDPKGETVFSQTTPAIVSLKRWQDYTVNLELAGYYPTQAKIIHRMDGWYIGNVFFGAVGLIGMVIVDPGTGAMWTLTPRDLTWNFISSTEQLTPEQLNDAELKANPPEKIVHAQNGKGSVK